MTTGRPAANTNKKGKRRAPPSKTSCAADALQLKAEGNAAFQAFQLDKAIELYTAAIAAAPAEPIYRANRSAALFEAGQYTECTEDIRQVLRAASANATAVAPALAAKLAVRAARCALWQNQAASAAEWLCHEALGDGSCAEQVADVLADLDACK